MVLVALVAFGIARSSMPACEEPTILEPIVRAEFAANKLAGTLVCLSTPDGDPTTATIRRLRRAGLAVKKGSYCLKGPKGVVIVVGRVEASNAVNFATTVSTEDWNLNGGDLATVLRRGVYSFERDSTSVPRLRNFRKTCCSIESGTAPSVPRPRRHGPPPQLQ